MSTLLATPRSSMRFRIPALLTFVVLGTGCVDQLPVPTGRYGAISAPAFAGTGGSYALRPQAAFYGRTDLSYVPITTDTCVVALYSESSGVSNSLNFLNAGDFIRTSVSGRVDSLFPLSGISLRVYEFPLVSGIPFTPGDTLTIVVPGATFPASAISVRTAEAFTHDSVMVPAIGAGLPVAWTAGIASGSQMTFSLRYNNGFTTSGLNEQVFCSFIDDGSATIPSIYLDGWRETTNNQRATRVTRVRSNEVTVDTRTRLVVISTFARPLSAAAVPTLR